METIADVRAELGEGPVWDEREAALLWVDIAGSRVFRFEPGGRRTTAVSTTVPVTALAPAEDGPPVVAWSGGFGRLDLASGAVEPIGAPLADAPDRMNDGACDTRGRFWAGSMTSTPGRGGLWWLAPGGRPVRALAGVTASNGIAWSPNDRTCYYVDTHAGRLDAFAFDADTATLSDRRAVACIDPSDGVPDGIAVDADGCVWVAVWGAGALRRYRPDGALDEQVDVPASQVTSCAFGGPELRDLYVTTARERLAPEALEREPGAGGLFRFRPHVPGLPTGRFRRSRT